MTGTSKQVKNPISGAAVFGLGGAAAVALGAAIRGNSVHNEAMTVLVGGSITGVLAGTFGCCLPERTEDSPLSIKVCLGALEASLALAATLTAPLIGEALMNLGTTWGKIIIDELVTSAVIVGGVAAVAGLGYGTYKLGQSIYSSIPPVMGATAVSSLGTGNSNESKPLDNSLLVPSFQNQV